MKYLITLLVVIYLALPTVALSAVGCTLNDPDKDIKKLFPGYTSYKTEFNTIQENGGKTTKLEVEKKLGDKLDTEYETLDVPYACYTIYKNKKKLGYVFGVNQKGIYGSIQVIIATNTSGTIKSWYIQKISHPEAAKLRNKSLRKQFNGLDVTDFVLHQKHYPKKADSCPIGSVKNPLTEGKSDFQNMLRGMTKALILFDIFKLDRAHD